MPTLNAIHDLIDARINPLLVRTLRQELRGRRFVVSYLLALGFGAVAALFATAGSSHSNSSGLGLFTAIAGVWCIAAWCLVPMAVAAAVARERSDDTWDLLQLSGLAPRRLLLGLIQGALVQGLVFGAALLPFLAVSYVLRGVDLLQIVSALIFVPMVSIALAALAAVVVAGSGNNRAARTSVHSLSTLLGAFLAFLSFPFWHEGVPEILRSLSSAPTYGVVLLVLGILNIWALITFGCLTCASALLTHPAQDRSSGPRSFAWLLWLNGLVWLGIFAIAERIETSRSDDIFYGLAVAGVIGVCLAGFLGFFTVTEPESLTARQARCGHDWRWRRPLLGLLGPGAARGRRCFLLMLVASVLLAWIGAWNHSSTHTWNDASDPARLATYIACYLLMLLGFGDALTRYRAWTPGLRRVTLFATGILWCLLPLLGLLFIDSRKASEALMIWSPITGSGLLAFDNDDHFLGRLIVPLLGVAGGATMAVAAFRRSGTSRRIVAAADDLGNRA